MPPTANIGGLIGFFEHQRDLGKTRMGGKKAVDVNLGPALGDRGKTKRPSQKTYF